MRLDREREKLLVGGVDDFMTIADARRVLALPEKQSSESPKDAFEAERKKRERAEKAKQKAQDDKKKAQADKQKAADKAKELRGQPGNLF
jgi:hypothetical protein